MAYRVIAFTMAQVRQGALNFQRELTAVLRERPEIKVYSANPSISMNAAGPGTASGRHRVLPQRRGMAGVRATRLDLQFLADVPEDELHAGEPWWSVCRSQRASASLSYFSCARRRTWACLLSLCP